MTTRSLGNMVVRLAVELAQYRRDWNEAADVTRDAAGKIDAAANGSAGGLGKLTGAATEGAQALSGTAAQAKALADAARAATGVTAILATGLGAVAAAAIGAGYAAYKGAEDHHRLNDALLLTGNAAGVVAGQVDRMAVQVASSIGGTVAASRDVLQGLVATGRFTAESMGEVSAAVQLVARFSHESTEAVLKDFAGMGNGVAAWAAKHNEAYNFLDVATYRYIKLLEEQGEKQAAMRVTSEALSEHLGRDLTQNLGFLDRAWRGVEDAASDAWSAMKDLGKPQTLDDQINEAMLRIEQARGGLAARSAGGSVQLQSDEALLRTLLRRREILEGNATAQAQQAEATQRTIKADEEWGRLVDRNRSRQAQMNAELEKARKLAAQKGDVPAAELAEQERLIRERFSDKRKGPNDEEKEAEKQRRLLAELSGVQASYATDLERLNRIRAQGNIDQERYAELLDALIAKQPFMKKALDEQAKAQEAANKEGLEATKLHEQSLAAIEARTARLQEETVKELEHAQALGLTKVQLAELEAVKLEETAASKERRAALVDEIDWSGQMGEAYRKEAAALRDLAQAKRAGAVRETSVDAAKEAAKEWDRTGQFIENTLTESLQLGFENGESFGDGFFKSLEATAKTTVLRFGVQLFTEATGLSPLSGLAGRFGIGGVGGGGGGGNGLMSSASNAYSLYSNGFASTGGNLGALYGGATGGMGAANVAGSIYANTASSAGLYGGSSLEALLATNGAYGTAGTTGAAAGGVNAAAFSSAMGAALVIAAPIMMAYADGMFNGEKRSGGEYRNGVKFRGPTGGVSAEEDAFVSNLSAAIPTDLNTAFRSFGSDLRVTDTYAAWEQSTGVRGGVYSGVRLSDGRLVGEDGSGTNYGNQLDPSKSKYEVWGNAGRTRQIGRLTVPNNDPDFSGNPAELATDVQQTYLSALQAAAGIVPRIVAENFEYTAYSGGGGDTGNPTYSDQTGTRWLRVFDQDMKDAALAAKKIPESILKLIIDIDPESLSAEASAALATRIQTMIANVEGFRSIVDALPVAQLKNLSFEVADALVTLQGGLENTLANLSSYIDNYYTGDERRKFAADGIASQLQGAGLAISGDQLLQTTREQFRALVEAAQPGSPAWNALMSVNGQFAEIAATAAEAAETLALTKAQLEGLGGGIWEYVRDLRVQRAGLANGPAGMLEGARATYLQDLALSRNSDPDALGRVTGSSQAYVDAQMAWGSDQVSVEAVMAQVAAELAALPATQAYEQRTIEALDTINSTQAQAAAQQAALLVELIAAVRGADVAEEARKVAAAAAEAEAARQRAAAALAAEAAAVEAARQQTPQDSVPAWSWIDQINSTGGPGGFAAGGFHTGGLRIVGEDGPELEATGPSRIYSASETRSMLQGAGSGGSAVVAELQALQRQLQYHLSAIESLGGHAHRSAKAIDEINTRGVPLRAGEGLEAIPVKVVA